MSMTQKPSRITAPPSLEVMARMRQALAYDPDTGHFTWLVRRGAMRAGERAGCWAKDGYWRFGFEDRGYYAHHAAWFFMTGEWPTMEIDHENSQPADNRWANLRLATTTQNHFNRRPQAASGFKGVYQQRGKNGWVAYAKPRGYLGYFNTPEEAARAHDRAAIERDPEFSYLNFPRADYAATLSGETK